MSIRRTTALAIAAGSAGSAVGQAITEHACDGVVHAVHVDYLDRLAFTSGSEEPRPGDVLSGATSGATGLVMQVVVTSGHWADGDAAGNIYITSQSGTFQSENLDNDSSESTNVATIGADSTAVVNTTDILVEEAISNVLLGAGLTVLDVDNNNTTTTYYPRVAVHDPTDGSALTGPVDYQSVGDQLRLSLAGANPADAVRITVIWDDMRGR